MSFKTLSFDDLVTQLEQNGTICQGWDIVCCYDLKLINASLASEHASAGTTALSHFTKTFTHDDGLGDNLNYMYDVKFGAPSIVFNSGSNTNCTVEFPILSGSLQVSKVGGSKHVDHTVTPNKYKIQAVVPLAYMYGDKSVKDAGHPFEFDPKNKTKAHIALHLPMINQSQINTAPDPNNVGSDEDKAFFRFFNDDFVSYLKSDAKEVVVALAGVSNELPPSKDEIVIQPKKFVFSTSGTVNGTLNLFIQTVNSGTDPGVAAPHVVINNEDVYPIPTGSTASLFLSPSFMEKVFFNESLSKHGFKNVVPDRDDKKTAAFSAAWDKDVSYKPEGAFIGGFGMAGTLSFEQGHFKFMDNPFHFQFSTDNVLVTLDAHGAINWTYDYYVSSFGDPPLPPIHMTDRGTGKAEVKVHKSEKISSIQKYTQKDISLNFTIDAHDFGVTVDSGAGEDSCWDGHMSSKIANNIQSKLSGSIPNLEVNMSGLYFFNITNLLFPGKQVINFDTSKPLKFPGDCLLVGTMKTNK